MGQLNDDYGDFGIICGLFVAPTVQSCSPFVESGIIGEKNF